jgi:hypothetical protein
MDESWWIQVTIAALGGGLLSQLTRLWRGWNASMWREIGALRAHAHTTDKEVQKLRDQRHDLLNQLNRERLQRTVETTMLKQEINELCRRLGIAPKYSDLLELPAALQPPAAPAPPPPAEPYP